MNGIVVKESAEKKSYSINFKVYITEESFHSVVSWVGDVTWKDIGVGSEKEDPRFDLCLFPSEFLMSKEVLETLRTLRERKEDS